MSVQYRVEMKDITKRYGGTLALRDFSIAIKPGEIHALIGENGAGKSTVVKILSGAARKDSGTIRVDGETVEINSPHRGKELGISVIYQEFALAPDLTVAENIHLHKLGEAGGFINWKKLRAKSAAIIESLGVDIRPEAAVGKLSVAYQQVVEIAKALSEKARILILDEPTAVLTPHDVEKLVTILFKLKDQGVSIIYISHRLEEVFRIADSITVLRDGHITGTFNRDETDIEGVIKLMVGRELGALFPKRNSVIGGRVLEAQGYTSRKFSNISFHVSKGEVIGFAGLVGSGRTEVARALFGADKKEAGKLFLDEKETFIDSPKTAVKNGLALIPESRKTDGLVLSMPVRENVSLANLKKITGPLGWLQNKEEKGITEKLVKSLSIKTGGIHIPARNLSGGNQQKVVLAKWFNTQSKVIIFDEPTRGVDVGAKIDIYNLINGCAEKGLGVIIISSEMAELIGMCDRIYVFSKGTIRGELKGSESTDQSIMQMIVHGGKA